MDRWLPNPKRRVSYALLRLLRGIGVLFSFFVAAVVVGPCFYTHCRGPREDCEAHERRLGVAMMGYIQDYDETLPLCNWLTSDHTDEWQNVIMPYHNSVGLMRCLDDPTPSMDPGDVADTGEGNRSIISYVYNSYLGIDIACLNATARRNLCDHAAWHRWRSRRGQWRSPKGMANPV